MSFLKYRDAMGIYVTLDAFKAVTGDHMGSEGTHPFMQGFPRVYQIPGGPELPTSVEFGPEDLMYPKAWGHPKLRTAIADYYRTNYGANITMDNVMVFAGGRPGLLATLLFLKPEIGIRIAETEYTPYWDLLHMLGRNHHLVPSNPSNNFRPTIDEYIGDGEGDELIIVSRPCNPSGVNDLVEDLVLRSSTSNRGLLIDEAYELFQATPMSALAHIENIDETNIFVAGAATKGFQFPGARIGWIVTSKENVRILGNFSSFGMGGVSHPSQLVVAKMLEPERVKLVRQAIPAFYDDRRERWGEALESLGVKLYTGDGGFYHWGELTNGMTAAQLNERLFKDRAAILKGTDCDMARRGDDSPMASFFRFSFGPLDPADFDQQVEIMRRALAT